ncbi:hypothetical protein PUNSTDRAFT_131982 [Punctularia strigosozonata HHB-11173 SS5]|uniref:uncharacterized protein n=1 Tax=Punctularia strigosozonata (strain HHB-11173) TaxID=741275 RepID=UPI0004417F29|nr:uncharacterized protein PUNSTDRAFT_131982 [Punctularia strigosozonata HHB-11173 SS5]EIN11830.1 hypothetical protein PUNSTDRAFT_131982 [Punctularia strigosozonata HHB-11173 SS5]
MDEKPRTLEVESEDERQQRIQSTLEKLNTPSKSHPSGSKPGFPFGDAQPDSQPGSTSQLLERVQAFLPQLAESNAELLRRAQNEPSSADIEHFNGDEEQYIEMNLGLGVFEQRRQGGQEDDDEETTSSESSTDSTSESQSDSSASSEDESSEADSDSAPAPADLIGELFSTRPTRSLPKRARPQIVMLDDSRASCGP